LSDSVSGKKIMGGNSPIIPRITAGFGGFSGFSQFRLKNREQTGIRAACAYGAPDFEAGNAAPHPDNNRKSLPVETLSLILFQTAGHSAAYRPANAGRARHRETDFRTGV